MTKNAKLAIRMDATGLSQAELARKINTLIEQLTGSPGCVTDRDIRRWLRGETRWPQDRIRLCAEQVLQASSEELGFIPRHKRGAAGAPPKDGSVIRRKFLTATGGAAFAAVTTAGARLGMSDADRFQTEYERILEEDWRIGGMRTVENRAAELALRIQSALSMGTTSARVRKRLHCLAADASSSAAFAAIDAKSPRRARTHLERAVTFAGLSGDSETQYHVWNCLAMTACQREDFTEGAAAAGVMKGASIARRDPLYLSLAHMRNARALARMNQRSDTLRALSTSEKVYARAEGKQRPAWLAFYDQSEVDGLAADIWFQLGDYGRAEAFFHRTLAGIRPDLVRNRALYVSHLALAQAHQGELEMACATGVNAYELLPKGSGSKRTTDALKKVRGVLAASGTRAPEVTHWIERSQLWS
ncbi:MULTISPECIES: XRE family transcriptional regulator [Streptomyces]|uniref:XRE family transcriptional regulator n=1 Tax=Streptomyces TaxID=1883 RepID=UPI001FD1E8AD|nr:XRE family transcriptional regulator [Streptomyces kasugaensis]